MNSLIPIGLFAGWWILGGLYARRQAVTRNLQEQPGRLYAALKGPLWVREMLVWSTLPPRDFNPDQDSKPSERNRNVNTGPGTPAIKEIAGWESPVDKGASGGSSDPAVLPQPDISIPVKQEAKSPEQPIAEPPLILPEPAVSHGIKPPELMFPVVPDVTADAGASSQIKPPVIVDSPLGPIPVLENPSALPELPVPVVVPPKKLPNQPKKNGRVKVLCPVCNSKQKYHADAICPSCHNPNPWLVGHWGLIAGATSAAVQDLPAEEAILLIPSGAQKPNRLPGKPMLGTSLKTLCPWCNSQQKYKSDAICPVCNNQNPWLVDKWKLGSSKTSAAPVTREPSPAVLPEPVIDPVIPSQVKDVVLPEPVIIPAPVQPVQNTVLPEPVIEPVIPSQVKDVVVPEPVIIPAPVQPVQNTILPEPVSSEESAVLPEPVIKPAATKAASNCGGCGRKAMPDLDGNCMFCGNNLGVES